MKVGPIICQVCNKPVDRVSFAKDITDMKTIMIAYCHGQRDRRTISNMEMQNLSAHEMDAAIARGGTAFDLALPK